jgi:hypothetical protein
MIRLQKHNWIGKPAIELAAIIMLPFMCCIFIFCLPASFLQNDLLPEYFWLFLVVFIDVGHVYSTLYRTYIDRSLVLSNKGLFFGLPLFLLVISILLHSTDPLWFWRILAYLAVYHFIRQQYGFLKIYSRKNTYSKSKQNVDTITIYAVTILPVIYWHFAGNRNFNWFIKGDFISFIQPELLLATQISFWLILLFYTLTEVGVILKNDSFNFQKNAILYGTGVAWYAGIIHYNSDIVFTLLNVICHGIPYMALVWIHGKKKHTAEGQPKFIFKLIYGQFSLFFFIVPLLLFAWLEEGLWDTFVWKEHTTVFPVFNFMQMSVSKSVLNILVPVLALPQLFHYVIDGFIWKLRNDKFQWTKIL